MKKLKTLFAALALCAPLTAAAQDIEINAENFPDENFRKYLLAQNYGKDGILTESEIQGVTSIDVSKKIILSLKGIEYFTALTYLNCSSNQLTTLDVSNNTALTGLGCDANQLTTLDVSNNTKLTELSCGSNQLTTLDVSNNTALTKLYCWGNQLTTLDVSKNTKLTYLSCFDNQLTTLNVSNNTALTYLYCPGNLLTTLDVSNNTALTDLYCHDNQLTALDVSNNTALEYLYCDDNQLTTLDVSNNTALTSLSCCNNQLTTLDVSNNTALKYLSCYNNQLTTLDVSNNTALTSLSCYNNQLTTLDVSNNTALKYLSCYNNQLTTLDVSNNTALTSLSCYNNQIKSEAMGVLVSSLPETTSGSLYVYSYSYNERNVITKAQVAAAKAKGWTTYDYYGHEYEGVDVTITVSVDAIGLATYCPTTTGIDFSDATEIAAYKASVSDNTVKLTRVETVAAGEGVLLRSINGGAASEQLPMIETEKNADNAFVGTTETVILSATVGNITNFVLSNMSGVVNFFQANNTYLEAGKAYLPVENYDDARGLTIVFEDDATGISEASPVQPADDAFYTLDGVRVTAPAKGLYIKNGVKVVIK